MSDYKELMMALREAPEDWPDADLHYRAADAIEELQQTVKHYKGCADDWYKEACDYKARLERAKSMVICEAEHTLMFDDRDEKTLMEMAKSLPFHNLVLTDNTPRWISVEERLPEDTNPVIAFCNGKAGNVSFEDAEILAIYEEGEGWWWGSHPEISHIPVTHWMPLPEPPKEG